MCGYDPFYWYEKDLDNEYLERIGNNMDGFRQAQQEYESRMFAPYDRGGAYFDEEEYQNEKEDYLETQAEYRLEEMAIERFKDDY
jgi:hypothetical protein